MNKIFFLLVNVLICSSFLFTNDSPLPLRKVVILTSGLAYYEHSGTLSGSADIVIPFRNEAMNDALKTLIINDPAGSNPSVTYQSENTLIDTLRSLTVDLSDSPSLSTILSRLRGAEAEILISETKHTGRITGVEYHFFEIGVSVPFLILNTNEGLLSLNFHEINSIKFIDPNIEQDLNRALDLISASRNSLSRDLNINLPGNTRRNVSISYVIPSPVWKVSYRLDLGSLSNQGARPLFQGWAIVDNDSDTDWNGVSLSLVAGRPASFIQELYPPYYVSRPVLPLAIAGAAGAAVHDRGAPVPMSAAPSAEMRSSRGMTLNESDSIALGYDGSASVVRGGNIQTAAGADAGGQFEFTIRTPVTLNRRMSVMLPLVESNIEARRTLIYNGQGRFPRLGAEITNTSSMKLPAGPITVYDSGVYAGDALLEFWNEGEKRLISFGEDLSVTAAVNNSSTRLVNTVNVSQGVMTVNRHLTYIRTYTFINSSNTAKQIIIEHTKTPNTELVSQQANEQTTSHYRFNLALPANRQTEFTVSERQPLTERISLLPLRLDILVTYSTNSEIPANVRTALSRAVELRRSVDAAETIVRTIEAQRNSLIADQDRIRRNLEAAGNQSTQGQEYLRRLIALDTEIDTAAVNLETARNNVRTALAAYENYLNNLRL